MNKQNEDATTKAEVSEKTPETVIEETKIDEVSQDQDKLLQTIAEVSQDDTLGDQVEGGESE